MTEFFNADAMPDTNPDGDLPGHIPSEILPSHASALAALQAIAHPEIGGQRGLWWCRAMAASELVKQAKEAEKR